jgi:hypothetical protein
VSTPGPGWQPDPQDPSGYRWWDGTRWTEHTTWAAPPQPHFTVEPDGPSSRGPLLAVVSVVVLLIVAGGAIAYLLARDDTTVPVDAATTTTAPTPVPTAPAAPSGLGIPGGQSIDQAALEACLTEKAEMLTAIQAAKVASQAGSVDSPAAYLSDPQGFVYYTWSGDTPAQWTLTPIGRPPC